MISKAFRYLKRRLAYQKNKKLVDNFEFENSYLHNKLAGMKIGKDTRIDPRAYFMHGELISIGDNCDINAFCTFMTQKSKISLGNNIAIAPFVSIIGDNMDYKGRSKIIGKPNLKSNGVTIADDCWIGIHAIILPGVNVGKGAVIGAGSVVTSDVEEFSVVAGNPAKKIKDR